MSESTDIDEGSALDTLALTALGTIPPSLQSLFDRDPLSLSDSDLGTIVAVLREQRGNFVTAETEAKASGRRVNAKKAIKGKTAKVSLAQMLEDI